LSVQPAEAQRQQRDVGVAVLHLLETERIEQTSLQQSPTRATN